MGASPDANGTPPISAAEIRRRMVNGTSWTAVNVGVTLPLAFLVNIVIARVLDVDEYGQLAYISAAIATISIVASMGTPNAAVTFATAAETAGDGVASITILRRLLGYALALRAPIIVTGIVLLTRQEPPWVTGVLVLVTILSAWTIALINSLAVEHRTAVNAKITMVSSLLTMAASLSAALATGRATAVWAARQTVEGVSMAVLATRATRSRRRQLLLPLWPRGFPPGFWRFAITSGAAGLVSTLVFSRSEIFLLEWMGQEVALGLFALAFGLSVHVTAPLEATLGPLVPAAAGLISQHPEQVAPAFARLTRVTSLGVACLLVGVIPGLTVLIPLLYGQNYAGAAVLFLVLALASGVRLVGRIAEAFVNGRRRGGVLLRANAISLVIGTLLAIGLIPMLGVWGAVIGNVAGQFCAVAPIVMSEMKEQGIPLSTYLHQARLTMAAIPIGTVVTLTGLGAEHPIIAAPAVSLAGLLTLFAVARLGSRRPLDPEDVSGMRDVLPRSVGSWLDRVVSSLRLANPS